MLRFVSYMQTVAIILVVASHSLHEYPDGVHGTGSLLYRMAHSFFMPLFFFISGLLLDYSFFERNKLPGAGKFVTDKIKRILVPFITLTLIVFIPRGLMSGMADEKMDLSALALGKSLLFTDSLVIPYLWFLQAILIVLLAAYLVIHTSGFRRSMAEWLLLGLFLALSFIDSGVGGVFSIGYAMQMCPFFAVGMVYCHWREPIGKCLRLDTPTAMLATITVWIACFLLLPRHNQLCWEITALAGVAMTLSGCLNMARHDIRLLDHLNGSYYMIFLLSWFFNVASQQVLHHYVELPWWIYTTLSLLTGIYLPLIIYRWLQGHRQSRAGKILAFLTGHQTNYAQKNHLGT